ncbi:rhomboid family intramembrane serine protease [Cognatishimia sp. SS12]|uniref:rhomboid family intramembrane serine protease n=1 Tax=Cognatishimia sp. SS12 TaxID=2979465 RepID=UPI00232B7936|nr:rhomboid family intramembrane serine protease [Cognatishimia sp. SS12]MDC0736846.1 rhomboid family intramembrane serine protease [Cognatishimia sp. SS12]
MFPIRDHNPSGRIPYVTYFLIAANVAIFLYSWPLESDPRALSLFYSNWALFPDRISSGTGFAGLFTSMFLHGGFMHIAGNMLFLWIFGDNLEDEMGHGRFTLFYLFGGIAAGLLQVASDPFSPVPTIGASGAVAAVLGGYLLLFPRAKVDILLILIVFIKVISIPAWVMLGIWFALQLINGLSIDAASAGVAYWAHAGGFVVGFLLVIPLWLRKGGVAFWRVNHGHPPHPGTRYRYARSTVPRVKRRR